MRGLVPRIHVFFSSRTKTWMAGTSLDKPGHDEKERESLQRICNAATLH
jgi:hypothetical protein